MTFLMETCYKTYYKKGIINEKIRLKKRVGNHKIKEMFSVNFLN